MATRHRTARSPWLRQARRASPSQHQSHRRGRHTRPQEIRAATRPESGRSSRAGRQSAQLTASMPTCFAVSAIWRPQAQPSGNRDPGIRSRLSGPIPDRELSSFAPVPRVVGLVGTPQGSGSDPGGAPNRPAGRRFPRRGATGRGRTSAVPSRPPRSPGCCQSGSG